MLQRLLGRGPGLQVVHVLGFIALLAALVLMSLRLLNLVFRNQPMQEVTRDANRFFHVGLVLTVVSGALAVARESVGQWVNLHVLTKGDLANELGFMDGRPHYAALRASGPTQVLSLEREKLESLLVREPIIVYRVMRAIFRVVHVILNRMAMQTSELTNYLYKVHGKY